MKRQIHSQKGNKEHGEQRANQRFLKGLKQYLSDDSMHIQRQYKKINKDRILRKKVSGDRETVC